MFFRSDIRSYTFIIYYQVIFFKTNKDIIHLLLQKLNNTTNNSNLNIQTNAVSQLKSTVGKGLVENVIKDIGDFITFNLMANFGEDEIAQALLNHEVAAVKGINVRENEF